MHQPISWMIRLVCLGLLAFASGAQSATAAGDAPRAVVVQKRYDFGKIPEGPLVRHNFTIENRGGAPLRILNVETNSANARIAFDPVIDAGGAGAVTVEVITDGDGGRPVHVAIGVQTDDPVRADLKLMLTGQIEKVAGIEPETICLEGPAGEPLTRDILIRPMRKYPFKILSVTAAKGDYLTFHLAEEHEADHHRYRLQVHLVKPQKGRFFDRIVIATDSPYRPEIVIGLYVKID
jgi:hypothetical protein